MAGMKLNKKVNQPPPIMSPQPVFDMSAMAMPQEDPQNMPTPSQPEQSVNTEMDPDFMQEIETYLIECKDNGEASIDMSDTLIQDHGAKMVAAVAAYCTLL